MKEKEVIISFVIFMMLDVCLGILSSIKQGRSIKSSIMLQGIGFKITMLFITSFTALILKYYGGVDLFKMFVLIGAFIEFKSIVEHVKIIWSIDLFKKIHTVLKEILHIKKQIKDFGDGNDTSVSKE
jgi:hypothetical protein